MHGYQKILREEHIELRCLSFQRLHIETHAVNDEIKVAVPLAEACALVFLTHVVQGELRDAEQLRECRSRPAKAALQVQPDERPRLALHLLGQLQCGILGKLAVLADHDMMHCRSSCRYYRRQLPMVAQLCSRAPAIPAHLSASRLRR